MDDVHKNIEEHQQIKKAKCWSFLIIWLLIWLMIKKRNKTTLFIRRRKLSNSLVFNTKPYFSYPQSTTLKSTQYFVMKIPNKRKF